MMLYYAIKGLGFTRGAKALARVIPGITEAQARNALRPWHLYRVQHNLAGNALLGDPRALLAEYTFQDDWEQLLAHYGLARGSLEYNLNNAKGVIDGLPQV